MATSGSKSIAATAQHTLKFSWNRESVDTANNKSTISWKLELIAGNGNIDSSASKTYKVVINGKEFTGTNTVGISAGKTKTLASSATHGNVVIAHNADGTKSFSYSFSQQFSITYSGSSIGTKSGSGTGTLDAISRVSLVSATNAYVGENSTITITRYNSNFKHTLHYKYGSKDYVEISAGKLSGTSYPWYVPYDILENTKNAKKATITIKCITYNGDTKIGEKTTTFTASFKESECAPYFYEPEVEDMNDATIALTGDPTKLIRYYSTARVYSNPHTQYDATLTDTIISNDTTAILDQVADFSNVPSGSFTLYAKDSRGFEKRQTLTAPIVNYVKLTCNLAVSAPTAEGNATLTVSGAGFGGNFGVVVNKPTLYIRLKSDDMESYTEWAEFATPTITNNKYSFSEELTGLDYKKTYTIQAKMEDSLMSKTSKTISVKTAPVFDWSADDFQFNVPVYTEDGYSLTGLAKALSNTYTLETEGTTAGTNWTVNNFSVVMLGNIVRCQYDITRSSATSGGNFTNETVINAKFKHNGKIKSLYTNPFASGGTGGVATYAITDAANDGTYITMKVNIAAAGGVGITQSTGAFLLPVVIDTTKY